MQHAKRGDTVRVHYCGTLDDGTELDSSRGHDPIELTLGGGDDVILGFESAIEGKRRDELVFTVGRDQLPPANHPLAGKDLTFELELVSIR